jgi:uncharacterized protein YqgQ
MKQKVFFMLAILSILTMSSNCEKIIQDMPFALKKQMYNGTNLRIDGYYYQEKDGYYYVSHFFYKSGIILYLGGRYDNNELKTMENEIASGQFTQKLKDNKYCWGLFCIDERNIQIERYYNTDDLSKKSFIRSGEILNDTTFSITKVIRSDGESERSVNETYHFKQFSPKPDSTNIFIK